MNRRFLYKSFLFFFGFSLLVGSVLMATSPVRAQQPTPADDEVNRIAKNLYCPVCENVPLDICPTQACAQWRALIREKLAAGWSEDKIREYFALQYGDRVLAEPPATGFNSLIYILPGVAFLVAAVLFGLNLNRMKKKNKTQEKKTISDDANLERIKSVLEKEYLNKRDD